MKDLLEKFQEFSKQTFFEEIGRDSNVLFVDALNSYIRCFAATPTMNDDGEHVGGITGFLKSVGLAVRQIKPSRVVIVFDGKGGSQQRRSIFKEYKSNRRSMEKLNRTYNFNDKDDEQKSMAWQLKLLIQALEYLPVSIFAVENIEADDSIAYLSSYVQEKGGRATIMSTDKDFLQLVTENCRVYNPVKKKIYDVTLVLEEYGIHPHNFIYLRALVGDNSDNIPGVKGVGPGSTKKLFPKLAEEEKQSLEYLYQSCYNEKQKIKNKTCEKILEHKDILERNMMLMDLKDGLVHTMSGNIRMNVLNQFNEPINQLNKTQLTLLLLEYKLVGAIGNLDNWILDTWYPLMRYKD